MNHSPSVPSVTSCSTQRLRVSAVKPRKIVVPLAVGLSWTADPEYIYQEKLDGQFAIQEVRSSDLGDSILAGEQMPSGEFFAFDCLQFNGEDIRPLELRNRLAMRDRLFLSHSNSHLLPPNFRCVPALNLQPSTLNAIFARGGEGIVRKRLDAPWGTPMEACKRLETFYCVVTGINAGQSVRISKLEVGGSEIDWSNSELPSSNSFSPAGSVPLFGGKCDRVRVGSILKLEGFGLTAAGKIREPRPCKDTPTSWLVKY